ncbi:MAG: response regulator [Anaerolineales bacterium]|nr:MAG: response regulator [Anaerolineales bacterium]
MTDRFRIITLFKRDQSALRITGIYLLVGWLWILYSDQFAAAVATDSASLVLISIYKGWGFIIVTSILLYWLIHSHTARLNKSEQRYRTLFEGTPVAIWEEDFSRVKKHLDSLKHQGITDFHAHFTSAPNAAVECLGMIKILDANIAAVRMYGAKSKDELIRNTKQILGRGEMEHIHEDFIAIAEGRTGNYWEGTDETLTGEPLEISLGWSVVPGHEKDFSKVIVTTTNVTERKRAEQVLKNSERRLHVLIENGLDNISLLAADGTLLWESPATMRTLGYAADEFVGRSIFELLHPQDAETAHVRFLELVKNPNNVERGLFRMRHSSGAWRWVEVVATNLLDEPSVNAIVINYRDVTERKEAEGMVRQHASDLERRVEERTAELTYANRVKNEFLANMSHELRTPLNSILGFSETLLEGMHGPLNDDQKNRIEIIASSGRHLLDLINDILDISKIEAGKLDIIPQTVGVDEICRASLNFIHELTMRKSITVEYSPAPEQPSIVADPKRLKQMLVNLLHNAAKFTPQHGEIKLEVQTDTEQNQIRFSVLDTGIGISAEDLQKLFNPFVQLDSSLSRHHEGSGLGLALVRKLADMHGGEVAAESKLGGGSRFTLVLPWKQTRVIPSSDTGLPDVRLKEDAGGIATGSTVTPARLGSILLAEDNETNVIVIKDYLEDRGFNVSVAHNGLEVLEIMEESVPDVVLMDIQMPGMDGLEATRRLRSDPRFVSIPIIAITAFAMPGDRERCLKAGANEYMSKPISLKALLQTIQRFL